MSHTFTSLLTLVFALVLLPAYASDRYQQQSSLYPELSSSAPESSIQYRHDQHPATFNPDHSCNYFSEPDTYPSTLSPAPYRTQSLSHGAQVYSPQHSGLPPYADLTRNRSHSDGYVKEVVSAEQQQLDHIKSTHQKLSPDLLENLVRKNTDEALKALAALSTCIKTESESTLKLLQQAQQAAQQHEHSGKKTMLQRAATLVRSKKNQATLDFQQTLHAQEAAVNPARKEAIDLGALLTMITHKAESYKNEIIGSSEQ